ncbi:MAG: Holliday junction branch migration protein RuvA [Holosporales bacterium]|jgi:Holliday junction DNA helicase RuvA|nr:Holliday junction branch migration protein RuvA [Holosporales bacterium]
MIAKLKGYVDSVIVDENAIIVDVAGVGYTVFASSKLINSVHIGDYIQLHIYHVIKAETQYLCGFQTIEEMRAFRILLNVHGVGVKSAIAVLSALSLEELAISVATQDVGMLVNAEGIGKKTAARILLELKDKTIVELDPINKSNSVNDAVLGLLSLGYPKNIVVKLVNKAFAEIGQTASANELIVSCLRNVDKNEQLPHL